MLHMPICAVHCQLLSLYITERPGPDKAWLAFSVDCRRTQTTEYRNRQFPSRYFGTPRRLILLALRVQRFLNTAINTGSIWLSSVQQRISTDWLLIFVNFLFGNFFFHVHEILVRRAWHEGINLVFHESIFLILLRPGWLPCMKMIRMRVSLRLF